MQKVLVTGGAGFIGSHLVKKLVEMGDYDIDVVDNLSSGSLDALSGLDIRCVATGLLPVYSRKEPDVDSSKVLVITGDFVDPNVLERISDVQYDLVFHLAANARVSYSVEHPTVTTEENVYKTVALFEACQKSNVRRVVFSSSSAVYGDVDVLPTSETATGSPQSPYGLQKRVCEDFARLFWNVYGADIVSLRYFNVYGPGQMGDGPYSTAVSAWCNATFSGKSLRSDGDGEQTRDMVYVGDVVDANILASEAPVDTVAGKAFNVATGSSISNNEILEMFKDQFEELIQVEHAPERPGDVRDTRADVICAETCLGFRAKVKFSEGLHRTWDWWADYTDDER